MLLAGGAQQLENLSFGIVDLLSDSGWSRVSEGCRYVIHVASPVPIRNPKHEEELILPARSGTLRALYSAANAGVERFVLTSSFAAIGYGHPPETVQLDERSWTNFAAPGVSAYSKSKTLAEKAAWEFIHSGSMRMEMSVVNPVVIFGPTLSADLSASLMIVQKFLSGEIPACPRYYFGIVDVRDVADLHLRAMTHPAANGERFLAVAASSISVLEAATILRKELQHKARKAPKHELPNWLIRALALFSPELRMLTPELGKRKFVTAEKAAQLLDWRPRPIEETIRDTAESLFQFGAIS